MNRNPIVAKAEVSAEVIGKVVNRLIEQLSYKAMGFLGGAFVISLAVVVYFRSRTQSALPSTPHHPGLYSASNTPLSFPITPMTPLSPSSAQQIYSPIGQVQQYNQTPVRHPSSPKPHQAYRNTDMYYVVSPTHTV
ncbi:hypothetical protein G9A89_017896 [Geosiphon pyriformis]|nr:hypothetical protein G9A89_017896 [Geosiphon pyriformis]